MIYLLSFLQAFYIDLHGDLVSGLQYTRYPHGYEEQTVSENDSKLFIPFSWSLRPEATINDHLSFFFTLEPTNNLTLTRENSYIPVFKEVYGFISSDLGNYKVGLFRKKHFGLGTLVNNEKESNTSIPSSLGFEGTLNLFSSLVITPFASLFSNTTKSGSFVAENTYELGISAFYKHQAQRLTLGVYLSLFDGQPDYSDLNLKNLSSNLEGSTLNAKKIIFHIQKKWHKFSQTLETPILLGKHSTLLQNTSTELQSFAILSESILNIHALWKAELLAGYISGQGSDNQKFTTMILHENFSPSYLLFKDNYGVSSYWNHSVFFRLQGKFLYEKWLVRFGSIVAFAPKAYTNNQSSIALTTNNSLNFETEGKKSLQGIELFVQAKYQWLSQFHLEGFFSYLFKGSYFKEGVKDPFTVGFLAKFSF